jgi:hypothetical protein
MQGPLLVAVSCMRALLAYPANSRAKSSWLQARPLDEEASCMLPSSLGTARCLALRSPRAAPLAHALRPCTIHRHRVCGSPGRPAAAALVQA